MKKTLAILLALAMLLSLSMPALAEQAPELSSWTAPLYLASAGNKEEITLYALNGQTEIPYIDMDTALLLLNKLPQIDTDLQFQMTMEQEGPAYTITRDGVSSAYIDFGEGIVAWDDFNQFVKYRTDGFPMDIVSTSGINQNGEPQLFQRSQASLYRSGGSMGVKLADFSIETVYADGKGYLPMVTFSDLFLAIYLSNLSYNGEAVFLICGRNLADMEELYYAVEPRQRSEALARFNYYETCLSLQFNYGLKEAHNIPSFGTLFEITGMEERLLSADALEADVALYDVINGYIDDLHTGFVAASPYAGNVSVMPTVQSISQTRLSAAGRELSTFARQAYSGPVPGYEEIGNTAYVTFNSFTVDEENDHYASLANGAEPTDTISLIMYAHSRIMREDSPIENVVLDLSLNTGGAADAAVYTIAWFLGECDIHLTDAINGAQSTMIYHIDANGDRVFDETDSVSSLNRYCIISPASFSCGNLVPCAFKSSSQVTLLGRQSGGGACSVQPMVSADGTIWQLSSRNRLSTLVNGSFYDVDQGAEPDYFISKAEDYYNREKLTDFINGLL